MCLMMLDAFDSNGSGEWFARWEQGIVGFQRAKLPKPAPGQPLQQQFSFSCRGWDLWFQLSLASLTSVQSPHSFSFANSWGQIWTLTLRWPHFLDLFRSLACPKLKLLQCYVYQGCPALERHWAIGRRQRHFYYRAPLILLGSGLVGLRVNGLLTFREECQVSPSMNYHESMAARRRHSAWVGPSSRQKPFHLVLDR